MSYREEGKKSLGTVLKQEQNIRIIEKHIYDTSEKQCVDEDCIEEIYKHNLYQTIGDILNGSKLSNMVSDIKNSRLGWNHFTFKDMQNMLDEQNDFIENPFAVEEGVLECKSRDTNGVLCGSKRVFSYQKQVRSSDEPMTTFASCCKCGTKWTYSG